MSLAVVPTTLRAAHAFVDAHHSHLGPKQGALFAVGVAAGDRLCCVAIVARPCRMLQNGVTADVTRVASDGTEHAASKAIGAATRMSLAAGYRRLVSYTLLGEAGTCYRAAGWWPTDLSKGGEWSCASRPRRPAEQPGAKVRWEYGPDAAPRAESVDRIVRESVGQVEFRQRRMM